jgi:hypothetical protein
MWNPFKRKVSDKSKCENIDSDVIVCNDDAASSSGSIVPCQEYGDAQVVQSPGDVARMERNGSTYPANEKRNLVGTGVGLAQKALDVYNTSLMVEQNIAAFRAASEVQLAQIATKFETCKLILDKVFQERQSALSAHYGVLDKAMKSNDREMIIGALRGISSIVVTSPLSDFKEIVNNWDNYSKDKPLELDF